MQIGRSNQSQTRTQPRATRTARLDDDGPQMGRDTASFSAEARGGAIPQGKDGAILGAKVFREDEDSTDIDDASEGFGPIDGVDDARNALPPDKQAQYDAIAAQLKGHPRALQALQNMLVMNQFNDQARDGSGDVLAQLNKIATEPLADGIDRTKLLGETVVELSDAGTISQKGKNTCGATVVQTLLADNNPAEYARLVAGLASPSGTVELQNGVKIHRAADWQADDRGHDAKGNAVGHTRSLPSELLQPAFMNVVSDPMDHYDNTRDTFINGLSGQDDGPGLTLDQEQRLMNDVLDENATLSGGGSDGMAKVTDGIKSGKSVVALLHTGKSSDSNHYVEVLSVANGKVNYLNPWGQRESMPVATFQKMLMGSQIADKAPAAPPPAPKPAPPPPPPPAPPPPPPPPSTWEKFKNWVESVL